MRIQVNLSSQPFRRDRPVIVATAVLSSLLIALLALLITLIVTERGSRAEMRQMLARLEREQHAVATEQAKLETILRKPENSQVLERSEFLNGLIIRKAISWTRIFTDLEKTMPYNVRVISIHPSVNPQNQVTLEMNVGAEKTEQLLEFLMKLENSDTFGQTAVPSSLAPSQTEPLFRYRVNVNYAQQF